MAEPQLTLGTKVRRKMPDHFIFRDIFSPDRTYTVASYMDPYACNLGFPHQPWFAENGGRLTLTEFPGLEWFPANFVVLA